jgi:hypothetical protein
MTPDQIIEQIWNLPWYQVIKIAIYDDFIVMCKIWPVYILLLLIFIPFIFKAANLKA